MADDLRQLPLVLRCCVHVPKPKGDASFTYTFDHYSPMNNLFPAVTRHILGRKGFCVRLDEIWTKVETLFLSKRQPHDGLFFGYRKLCFLHTCVSQHMQEGILALMNVCFYAMREACKIESLVTPNKKNAEVT